MTPVANFLVSPNLLQVSFTDISTNNPTSWSWDFGDSQNSSSQNVSHTYSTPGKYIVKLTVSNSDGSNYLQREIIIDTVPVLPVSLKTFLNLKLLPGVVVSEEIKDAYIAQWQLFIQPLVSPRVDINDVFKETAYPPLANALIAMLAAYSISMDKISQGGVSSVTTAGSGGSGVVKKIVTGPSEVEFQDISKSQQNIFGDSGLIGGLQSEICQLASRLLIFLPMCPPLPDPKILNVKAGRISQSTWCQFPEKLSLYF